MERTKQAIVKKSESSSADLESTNNTTNAFKAYIKSDVDSQIYRDIPPAFFIGPASRMLKPFTNAENYAMKSGKVARTEMTAERDSNEDDYTSDSDALPSVCSDYEICDNTALNNSSNIPTEDQLSRFVSCLKNCHPFVNHLLLVQDQKVLNNCLCPIPSIIDWMNAQWCGLIT